MTRLNLKILILLLAISCNPERSNEINYTNNESPVTDFRSKMGMREILKKLSVEAIRLGDVRFTTNENDSMWIGSPSASILQIKEAEERLKVELPKDYKDFLLVSNGFPATTEVDPTFLEVEKIDYLKNIDPELISIWRQHGMQDVGEMLSKSILIAGVNEEQCFLIIPPKAQTDNWTYWKFAAWIPGEDPYLDIESYFLSTLDFVSGLNND